jgi:integrase/recombinase XerD
MNLPSSGLSAIQKDINGFLYFKMAEGLSNNTITSYRRILAMWMKHVTKPEIKKIRSRDIVAYLAWLRNEYTPVRFNGNSSPLKGKTLRNHWVTLKSFFRWAAMEFVLNDPMLKVPAPKFTTPEVIPFEKNEIMRLLKATKFKREAKTRIKKSYKMRRPTSNRDESLILTLLDTGMRSSEICCLSISDLDLSTGRIGIQHAEEGGAKGGKGRSVYLGLKSRKVIWRYLNNREDSSFSDRPLFLSTRLVRMNPNSLRQIIKSLANSALVENCYPHRFRHTFAISYLRSGGDVFTLQRLLGHQSLDMVKHYARVAEVDLANAHRKASPVDNLYN